MQDRRTFLKTTALAGAAAASVPFTSTTSRAQKAAVGSQAVARGFVFATLRRSDGYGLGVRTNRGILDVVAAEHDLREGAPLTISDVFDGKGDLNALRRLGEKAQDSHFVAIDKAAFGPCVTSPEKIICVGLNYRKHAAETGNPVPKAPILFNKFNTALNHHGGVIGASEEDAQKFDYEAELVIVIGKTARNVSEADAPGHSVSIREQGAELLIEGLEDVAQPIHLRLGLVAGDIRRHRLDLRVLVRQCDLHCGRQDFLDQGQPLAGQVGGDAAEPSDVGAGPSETRNKTGTNRVSRPGDDDWDTARCLLSREGGDSAFGYDKFNFEPNKLFSVSLKLMGVARIAVSPLHDQVLALDPSKRTQMCTLLMNLFRSLRWFKP